MPSTSADSGWTVFVLPSSHNDVGWAGTPSEIAEHRANSIVDSVLSLMEQDPDFTFTVEAALYLREYAERRPERLPLLTRFMEEGRLECSGSYIQPYEGLLSGESLIRQLTWGRQWIHDAFGVTTNGYWNIDVAGRTRQIPQILAKSGLQYMVLSRNQPGLYWWQAPDGSKVLVLSFMEGSYGHSPILRPLFAHLSPLDARGAPGEAPEVTPPVIARNLVRLLEKWEPFFEQHNLPRYFLIIAAADYTVPDARLRAFVDSWNEQAASGELPLPVPVRLRFGNAAQYIAALEERADLSSLEVISGELPNPWIYIHGACHHKTVTAMRGAAHYLSTAEAFGAAQQLAGDANQENGIARDLEPAWLEHLYPDHGYGGLHGEGTDEVFRQKEESALHTARQVARRVMTEIAQAGPFAAGCTRNLTVFNPLSWDRTDWVECEVILSPNERVTSVSILDQDGRSIPFQAFEASCSIDGALQRVRLGFIANNVPSLGYRSFSLVPSASELDIAPTKLNSQVPEELEWANDFARIRITRGGMVEWFDKQQRRNLISADHYLGFEVIELGSPGHDVGEGERDISNYDWEAIRPFQPTPLGLERTSDRGSALTILEDGAIRTRVMTQSVFTHCLVTQTFTLFRTLDRVEVGIDVERWDGTHGRELRLMVPFGVPEAEISYDVPFGHVIAGRDEAHSFASVRPREVQSWLHASGKGLTGTLSSSVVAHDWSDPVSMTDRPVLQAILLATKRSCHPKGPWYSQAGNHSFSASMSGTPVTLVDRTRFGRGCQRPMDVIVTGSHQHSPPDAGRAMHSYLSVDQPNVVISALKSSDKQGEPVVRCWEVAGISTSATLTFSAPVREVWACDLLDNEQHLLWSGTDASQTIPVDIAAFGIVTLKLKLANQPGTVT